MLIAFKWPARLAKSCHHRCGSDHWHAQSVPLRAPILGDIPTGLPVYHASLNQDTILIVFEAALMALLGSIDGLLTSLVADNMTAPGTLNRS